VARACCLVLEHSESAGGVFNVGSGQSYTIAEIGERIAAVLGKEYLKPEITGKYRVGDIRHCFADISLARSTLGYEPSVDLEEGLEELAGWLEGQVASDRVEEASAELASRGLTV
jgi:dTDP-L-rhamnose 4-epimerase